MKTCPLSKPNISAATVISYIFGTTMGYNLNKYKFVAFLKSSVNDSLLEPFFLDKILSEFLNTPYRDQSFFSKCVWIRLSLNDLLVISIPPRGSCPPPVKTLSGWTVSFKTNQASQSIRRSKNLIKQAKKYSETWKHSFYNNCLMARVDL